MDKTILKNVKTRFNTQNKQPLDIKPEFKEI